jgi:hypothetical protein
METVGHVQHLRQVLLWPLRLVPRDGSERAPSQPWELLTADASSPWREVSSARDAGESFQERYYTEFVSFLPYVQRFLFGVGQAGGTAGDGHFTGQRHILRRRDITQVRVALRSGEPSYTLDVHNVCLHFFYDVDILLLVLEVGAEDLPLETAQDLVYRFGRAYPAGWDAGGNALHCMYSVEWMNSEGAVLAASDAQDKQAFTRHVCENHTPLIASHWRWLLQPLVPEDTDDQAPLQFRLVEYYRMPMMAYLSLHQPDKLDPGQWASLGMVAGAPSTPGLASAEFERSYCYDRFWYAGGAAPNTRYLCTGYALMVVGDAASDFFCCRERGVLSQFRHQHFLLFMIAHLQKASLLMFSDRLAEALNSLNVTDPDSVRRFKRRIRYAFETFLRFTHRYWFTEISDQAQIRALFRMSATHLDLARLHSEVKVRMADMNGYLEADSLRRQANTVVRLTVVTIFGLIGTVTTGFLGMNLMAEADASMSRRLWIFGLTFGITTVLTTYTMVKSKRLSDLLDALSDERLSAWTKLKVLAAVWGKGPA